jgi:hypothetical protein
VTVRDATSSASTEITVEIRDDAPSAALDPAAAVLIEEESIGTAEASVQFSVDVSGTASKSGADTPATKSFALELQADGVNSGISTRDGQPVLLYSSGANTVVGRTATGTEAFRIGVDAATGIVTVTLLAALSHPTGTDVLQLNSDILFASTTIVDADGDSSTASVDFSTLAGFGDSEPVVRSVQGAAIGNEPGLSVTGHLEVTAPDTIASYDLSPSLARAPEGLVYSLQADGSLVARETDGDPVFRLSIDSSGDYTLTSLRVEEVLTARAPNFSTVMASPGSPYISSEVGLYESYLPGTPQRPGAGIGSPVTTVVISSVNGVLNPSNDGLGIGNNLIDNPVTAPAERLGMQFADALSNASLTVGNLKSSETLTWKVYLGGALVDSGVISGTYIDSNGNTVTIAGNESPTYAFDLARNGLDEGVLFDRIELSAGEGSSYKFIDLGIEKPVLAPMPEMQLEFSVVALDGDGDASAVVNFSVNMAGSDGIVRDTAGDTVLMGSEGADVFQWNLAEPGARDTVSDFDMANPTTGGDVLDIHDLLPPESAGNLESYLRFEDSGSGGTLLKISHEGNFTGDDAHDAGVSYQSIDLQSVDFSSLGNSQQQIIDNLLSSGKLITD